MILKPGMPEATTAKVYDTITGELLKFVAWVDTKTGVGCQYSLGKDGKPLTQNGEFLIEGCPNPVRVERP